MPAKGGDAVQLTFGPYYDDQPVVSPDGKKIAFISNRDGSDGNVFILDLNTNKITGITHVFMAGSPTWSPDGTTIAFLSFYDVKNTRLIRFLFLEPATEHLYILFQ